MTIQQTIKKAIEGGYRLGSSLGLNTRKETIKLFDVNKNTADHYILTPKTHKIKVVDLITWAKWFETAEKERRVAQNFIGDVHVSTVFLGLDYNWGTGKPLLFETMIFGGERDGETERYATWNEAEKGHKKIVASLQSNRSHNAQ